MAESLPNALVLRHTKYSEKTSAKQRSAVAARLLEAGRTAEALDLYLLAGDEQGASNIKAKAIADGRPVLLLMLIRAGREVTEKEWIAAGEAAQAAQRWRQAHRCFLAAGDEAKLEALSEKLPGYEVYTPQGK